jgi:hypothetical protein
MSTNTQKTQPETLTDRELLERIAREVDHLDVQVHEIRQFIDENRAALAKATKFLHNPVTDYLAARPKRTKGGN